MSHPSLAHFVPEQQIWSRWRNGFNLAAMVFGVLLFAGLAAWSVGITGPYQFDDRATPLGDPASQSLAAWQSNLSQTLRPVTKLTYALESQAGFSDQPAQRRMVSLLLQICAAGLLLAMMRQLEPRATAVTTVMLAAIWFIHPVHADSILLLSGRTALLSVVFLLAALLSMERGHSWATAGCFVLACLSRETALAGLIPIAILVASQPGVTLRSGLRQLTPVFLGLVVVVYWFVSTPRYVQLAEFSFLGRPYWNSVISQVGAIPAGLHLLLRPSALSIDYGIALPDQASDTAFVWGLALVGLASAGIVWFRKRSRAAAIGLAVWLAALLPTQSLIPKLDPLSNRPLSLALAGLLLVTAAVLGAAWSRISAAFESGSLVKTLGGLKPRLPTVTNLGMLLLIGFLIHSTAQRSALFQSELDLWQDAASKSVHNARPHLQYALLLKEQGRDLEAWRALSAAQAIDPFSSRIADLARVYQPRGEIP